MRKKLCIVLFIAEAVLLGITLWLVVQEGTSWLRATQSMLLLAAFGKTEYDFLRPEPEKKLASMDKE